MNSLMAGPRVQTLSEYHPRQIHEKELAQRWEDLCLAQSCLTLHNPMDCPWNSPGQNTRARKTNANGNLRMDWLDLLAVQTKALSKAR